jgi:hypothetical protein
MEITDLLAAIQGGGNVALVICTVAIWRAGERLARIEKALDKFIQEVSGK